MLSFKREDEPLKEEFPEVVIEFTSQGSLRVTERAIPLHFASVRSSLVARDAPSYWDFKRIISVVFLLALLTAGWSCVEKSCPTAACISEKLSKPATQLKDTLTEAGGTVDMKLTKDDELLESRSKNGVFDPILANLWIFNPVSWVRATVSFLGSCGRFIAKPGWKTVASEMDSKGEIRERPARLCSGFSHAKAHGLSTLHNGMGASCLVFWIPPMIASYLCYTGNANYCYGYTVFLCGHLFLTSVVSFYSDYWYSDDAKAEEGSIPEYKKQWVMNQVDLKNVPLVSVNCLLTCAFMYFYAPVYNLAYPAVAGVFALAAYVQQLSYKPFKEYEDIVFGAEGYDFNNPSPKATAALRKGYWMHIWWHILAVVPPIWIVYGMCAHGAGGSLAEAVDVI